MKWDINIDDIEEKRDGLEEVLAYAINRYEEETGMIVEEIKFKRDGSIVVFDRLTT